MRTILCPIDFSETSIKALLYAYDLALKNEAKLILLHTYHFHMVVPLMVGYQQPDIEMHWQYERESLEKMENLINWLNKIHAPAKLTADCRIVSNFAVDEIIKTIYEEDINLIVMGTSGANTLQDIFSGNITVRVIEETRCPVLMVSAASAYKKIDHILYASQADTLGQAEIDFVTLFAKAFNANISLLQIEKEALAASHQAQAISAENKKDVKQTLPFKCYTSRDPNIQHAIGSFMENKPVDLLIIAANRKNLFEQINSRNETTQTGHALSMPVLVMHK